VFTAIADGIVLPQFTATRAGGPGADV
jgi:hypothetical protein